MTEKNEHLHHISHTHDTGYGIKTIFTCTGDRTSPCHQYPPDDAEMETWGEADRDVFVTHDECWLEQWMEHADCATLCGPDGEPVRSGPINATWGGDCVEWDYAEVQRLRELTTVEDDMVERAALVLGNRRHRGIHRGWAGATSAARDGWRDEARAALEAALNPGSSHQPRGGVMICPYCGNEARPYTGYVEGLWVCNSEQRDDCYSISRSDEPFKYWARKANAGDPQWGTWRDGEGA